jgi:hypothetical protein
VTDVIKTSWVWIDGFDDDSPLLIRGSVDNLMDRIHDLEDTHLLQCRTAMKAIVVININKIVAIVPGPDGKPDFGA